MKTMTPNPGRESAGAVREDHASKTNFFTVFVDKHVYGLEVTEAQTIFRVGEITPIPLIHKDVAGFINLRGKIVVAVSLRRRLGIPAAEDRCERFAIGLEAAGESFALLVDRVGDVLALPHSARTDMPPHFTGRQSLFTRALYLFESRLTPILDVKRLFDFSI
jgi:purine-binding chemotaxis protein CheW